MFKHNEEQVTPFGWVDNEAINDPEISAEMLAFWLYLKSKPEAWKVRIKDLQNRFGFGVNKTKKILASLVKAGCLSTYTWNENGRLQNSGYIINKYRVKPTDDDSANSDRTKSGRSETMPQLNNKYSSNKELKKKDIDDTTTAGAREGNSKVYSYYMSNIQEIVPPLVYDKLSQDIDEFGDDMVLYAIELASIAGAHSYGYMDRIFAGWRDGGIDTLEKAKARERDRKRNRDYSKTNKGSGTKNETQGDNSGGWLGYDPNRGVDPEALY